MSLKIENLTVYYQTLAGDVQALEDATFSVADGEIMGVAGESGCGKSTLSNSLIYLHAAHEIHQRPGHCWTVKNCPFSIWKRWIIFASRKISVIPQYAMNAMNPTRKIGKMIHELLEFTGRWTIRISCQS